MKFEICPENISLKVGESLQLTVVKTKDNGDVETVGDVRWRETSHLAFIDQYGTMTAVKEGKGHFVAELPDIASEGEGKVVVSGDFEIFPNPDAASINKQFDRTQREEGSKRYESDRDKKLRERHEERVKKAGLMKHTRATVRMAGNNKDIVWFAVSLIVAALFGGSVVLLINGFSVERIGAFLTMFLSTIGAIFGKLYSPQGEISEDLEIRMAGSTRKEKLRFLTDKKERIETKIQEIEGLPHGQISADSSYYHLTLDENS